jgi:tRNA/tmRNA/rRNA uracil-C5-methylase (TrmA/RlmC/RlmD family)
VSELRLNERSEHALRGLGLALAELGPGERAKIAVISAGRAGEAREAAAGMDAVIVDPPRKGLDSELLQALCERPPEQLLYVSCGVRSLLRDVAQLTAGGALRLAELTAFNLMPFTDHVETVARFERA